MDYQSIQDAPVTTATRTIDDSSTITDLRVPVDTDRTSTYMYTPYSDFTEQEDFAAEYRRHIARLYTFFMPVLFLITSISATLFSRAQIVASILFFFSVFFFVLGVIIYAYFDALFDMFSVGDFMKLPLLFHLWPSLPLVLGLFTAFTANPDTAHIAIAIVLVSIIVIIINFFAYRHTLHAHEERLLQWPPLPGTEIETYLHC